jgi:ATP-dependent RNA helicase SUPV3L1/SUV3
MRYADWIAAYADQRAVGLPDLPRNFKKSHASDDQELHEAEMEAKTLTVYAWLAYRYPEIFPELEACQKQRQELDDFIERSLAKTAMVKACRNCQKTLAPGFPHKLCDECYYEGY